MTDTFRTRIPTLSEAQLRQYLERPEGYKAEAVEAALAELRQRGHEISPDDLGRIRQSLQQRDAAQRALSHSRYGRLLGNSPAIRTARIRLVTAGILAAGLGSTAVLYAIAAPKALNPLGYEPEDTKRYLRDLELYGGKANILATEFRRWFDGLWHGRPLAFTVATLTILLALGFWFVSTHLAADPGPPLGEDGEGPVPTSQEPPLP
ncbi:MAG TPA: hypothetical protein VGK03_12815 [Geothrix sp.]|jgi:hypothetical protein